MPTVSKFENISKKRWNNLYFLFLYAVTTPPWTLKWNLGCLFENAVNTLLSSSWLLITPTASLQPDGIFLEYITDLVKYFADMCKFLLFEQQIHRRQCSQY